MFGRRRSTPQREDPAVAAVEQILTSAAERSASRVPTLNGRFHADRAVWLCACVTDFDADAPRWLIVDIDDGGVGWCRMPDRMDAQTFVAAPLVVGDHVHPEQVLHWLQDREARSWPCEATADRAVIEELGQKIRGLQAG